ncbi:hypothetical protein LPJ72_005669, partial [Coemansia sp. Benny D160-2]
MKLARKSRSSKRKSNANQLERGVRSEYECMTSEQKRKRQRVNSELQTPNSSVTENASTNTNKVQDERKKEAEHIADNCIRENTDSVFSLIKPSEPLVQKLTDSIVYATLKRIKQSPRSNGGGTAENEGSFDLDRAIMSTHRLRNLKPMPENVKEANMYPLIKDLIMLVAHHVREKANSHNEAVARRANGARTRAMSETTSAMLNPHVILPYEKADYKPDGGDDGRKVDVALGLFSLLNEIKQQKYPKYKDMFAIIEAKRDESDSRSAYAQLIDYTRNIYANQDRRRYAWGMTLCGTQVRCCLFYHDDIRASSAMDISTPSGLKKFVTLLVHWSFCGSERLGYDPTMAWNKKTGKLEITCTSHGDKNSSRSRSRSSSDVVYEVTKPIMSASALFGRHTRCYLARRKGSRRKEEVVIKDSWSLPRDLSANRASNLDSLDEVERSYIAADAPDEARNLRLISEKLAGMELDFLYPKAESSGDVILSGGIADNTNAIFSFDKDEDRKLFRVHRRIVMSPVGHYLSTVHNEEEFVLAVADAMECHNTILTKCRLLHRDISVNNILVVREFEGRLVRRPVKGLLIDYDHAISIDKESSGCATRSGTLPFMSIHNLMGHDSKRTALDDWESLLYLVCWQATFGINNADRKDVKADKVVAEALKWRDGDMVDIANEK